jgi:small conductance mechanosensitive channel
MSPNASATIGSDPLALISAKVDGIVDGFFFQLPNILAGLALLLTAWTAGALMSRSVAAVARRRGRPDLGALLGSLAKGVLIILALLFASAIIFPSVKPGDIIGMLGIGSVAIGFAFRDILQNLLAGLLLLIRRPFKRGDQIVVKDFEGTVHHIESRATYIKTYDGRQVIIPNADLYTSPVIVNTAFDQRRDEYDVGIGYGDDVEAACELFRQIIAEQEGVLADPPAEALPWELAESTVNIRLRWWTHSTRAEQVHVRARVIAALFKAAKANGIDLAYPTQVLLFHDQTEEVDGDRSRQREGWPAGNSPPKARPIGTDGRRPGAESGRS